MSKRNIELPDGHVRPKIKFKPVGKHKPPPPPSAEERKRARAGKHLSELEKRFGINSDMVSAVILAEHGLLTPVAKKLKMPRAVLQRYIDNYESCQETLSHARNVMGDIAEKKLFDLIEQGDVRCILYYLSTVHRARGYGLNNADNPENHSGRGPIYVETVNITGVPSGTFLPAEPKRGTMVIDN